MTHLHLNSAWEILYTDGGDVLFVHCEADHLRLSKLAPIVEPLIDALLAGSTLEDVLATVEDEARRCSLRTLVDRLMNEGVLLPGRGDAQEFELDPDEHERFRTLLAWLRDAAAMPHARTAYQRLRQAKLTIIGAGGAGSLAALMLASCGVGHLTIVDGDVVSRSNLVRQVLYTEAQARARTLKVEALREHLEAFSPYTQVEPIARYVADARDCLPLVRDRELVLLSADAPRIVLNREVNLACVRADTPLVHAFLGQVGPLYVSGRSACFHCLEHHWRQQSGDEHDEIVELMLSRPTREYPSMVLGPVGVAQVMVEDALALITGLWTPRSMAGLVRLGPERSVEPIARVLDCPVCVLSKRSRP